MFLETKKLADSWEKYVMTAEEVKHTLLNLDEKEALEVFYKNSARVIMRAVAKYRNIDKDLLASAGYTGIIRTYQHLKRNPHKLDKYPFFFKNCYLWISASLNQLAAKEQRKTNDLCDPVVFEYASTADYTKQDELLEYLEHHLSEDEVKLLTLHLDGVKKRNGSSIMKCSMQEFSQRLSDLQDKVALLIKETA